MTTNQILLKQTTQGSLFESVIQHGEMLKDNKVTPKRYVNVQAVINDGWRLVSVATINVYVVWFFEKYAEPFAESC